MTNLTGRELDAAVAQRLGWTQVQLNDVGDYDGRFPESFIDKFNIPERDHRGRVPEYSVAHQSVVARMLQHIASLGYEVAIWIETNGACLAAARRQAEVPYTTFNEFDGDHDAEGATINEAIARLVVAVAAAPPPAGYAKETP